MFPLDRPVILWSHILRLLLKKVKTIHLFLTTSGVRSSVDFYFSEKNKYFLVVDKPRADLSSVHFHRRNSKNMSERKCVRMEISWGLCSYFKHPGVSRGEELYQGTARGWTHAGRQERATSAPQDISRKESRQDRVKGRDTSLV